MMFWADVMAGWAEVISVCREVRPFCLAVRAFRRGVRRVWGERRSSRLESRWDRSCLLASGNGVELFRKRMEAGESGDANSNVGRSADSLVRVIMAGREGKKRKAGKR